MQTRKKYDFSSVGELKEDLDKSRAARTEDRRQIPYGIKVPLEFGENSDGILKMHYSADNALADNFRTLS